MVLHLQLKGKHSTPQEHLHHKALYSSSCSSGVRSMAMSFVDNFQNSLASSKVPVIELPKNLQQPYLHYHPPLQATSSQKLDPGIYVLETFLNSLNLVVKSCSFSMLSSFFFFFTVSNPVLPPPPNNYSVFPGMYHTLCFPGCYLPCKIEC